MLNTLHCKLSQINCIFLWHFFLLTKLSKNKSACNWYGILKIFHVLVIYILICITYYLKINTVYILNEKKNTTLLIIIVIIDILKIYTWFYCCFVIIFFLFPNIYLYSIIQVRKTRSLFMNILIEISFCNS